MAARFGRVYILYRDPYNLLFCLFYLEEPPIATPTPLNIFNKNGQLELLIVIGE